MLFSWRVWLNSWLPGKVSLSRGEAEFLFCWGKGSLPSTFTPTNYSSQISMQNRDVELFHNCHHILRSLCSELYILTCAYVKPWPNGLASSHKLDLRKDLRWVAKRTLKFTRKNKQAVKKNISKRGLSLARPIFYFSG